MQAMKKTILSLLIAIACVGCFTSLTHAQSACSETNITSDSCYEQNCTGQATEDSQSCQIWATADANAAGNPQCASINTSNENTCCNFDPNNPSDDSPMCVAYNDYTAADVKNSSSVINPNSGSSNSTANTAATAQNQNVPLNIHLQNPLSGVSTIPDAINKILSIVIRIALPLIILFFIWSGLKFIFARGNPKEIETAKNMFLYTVIGALLILGAWVITNAIIGTVNAIIST
jgi:hypothetical protein